MRFTIITITLILALFIIPQNSYSQKISGGNIKYKKAKKYFFKKKFEMAEILFLDVLKTDPENKFAYSYLGDIYLYKSKYDTALRMYKKAVDLDPNMGENYFRIGQVYYYKKYPDLAIENFKKSVKLNNKLKFAYYHIGLSYLMLKRNKEHTINNWETFLKISPKDSQHDKIRRAIELLKDPKFEIPPVGSDISIEEALLFGGSTLKKVNRKSKDKKAGNENKKTNKKIEEIYTDDDM